MKRVFEFYTGKGQQDITTLAESLECVRKSGKPTRIIIEDLSEIKPEPEKTCENCANHGHVESVTAVLCDLCKATGKDFMGWQPKSTEQKAEGWEQRFDKEFPHCGGAFKTSVKSFIRAEIERVREEAQDGK